jgi:Uma2 family endonuclease
MRERVEGYGKKMERIITSDSIARDRGDKFVEYEAGGLSECWLIDPLRQQAEFYQLAADGRYRLVLPDADGIYHSRAVPGFHLRPAWLWSEPLPKVLDVARELGLLD